MRLFLYSMMKNKMTKYYIFLIVIVTGTTVIAQENLIKNRFEITINDFITCNDNDEGQISTLIKDAFIND